MRSRDHGSGFRSCIGDSDQALHKRANEIGVASSIQITTRLVQLLRRVGPHGPRSSGFHCAKRWKTLPTWTIAFERPAGTVSGLACNAALNRDASLLKEGHKVLKLTIPAGGLTSGIIYDSPRLELDGKPAN